MEYTFNTRLPKRFWDKVIFEKNSCWIWDTGKNKDGYGMFNHELGTRAYVVAYKTLIGAVPLGLELDHLCKHRDCVNPFHLEPVTHQENVRRGRLGETTKARKLKNDRCPQGHLYDFKDKDGYRGCRTCERARDKQRRPAQGPANQLKTYCPRGHEYTPENTILEVNSWRKCRRCKICRKGKRCLT